jgi:hypothetical protein
MGIRMPCAMGGRDRASRCVRVAGQANVTFRSCIVVLSGYTVGSPPRSATQETLQEENL